MVKLAWDETGKRLYETGTDRGVLALQTGDGAYSAPLAWNGLTKVTESPDGGEETALWANNGKYLSLLSTENFKGTIEAYTYPEEFSKADGSAEVVPGVLVGQQRRVPFGLAYRTLVGNDTVNNSYGYKLHFVWGAKVSPSERAYETVNDSPSAITFSWAFNTTPVDVGEEGFEKTASFTIDSTKVDKAALAEVETLLYGGADAAPTFPTPQELLAIVKKA